MNHAVEGTEIVALAAGEAENPRKNVPKAINKVFYRILIFYVGGMTVVGLLVPYTSPDLLGGTSDAASSPFVIAIKSAGISVLPDTVNVVILTAVFSAANSDLCRCFYSGIFRPLWHEEDPDYSFSDPACLLCSCPQMLAREFYLAYLPIKWHQKYFHAARRKESRSQE
jgi:hypothetical protein